MSIWVCGEVLIDLLPGEPERIAVVGGGAVRFTTTLDLDGDALTDIIKKAFPKEQIDNIKEFHFLKIAKIKYCMNIVTRFKKDPFQ